MSLFDANAAKEFLKLYDPEGPWILQRISVDRTRIGVACFTDLDEIENWLIKYNTSEKDNIYFQVNRAVPGLPFGKLKKLGREHILEMTHLHVDLDPQPGKNFELERRRILSILQDPPDGIHKPTHINDSGGGYQAFWRLEKPFLIGDDSYKYDEAALYNLALEKVFDADACHNVDRVMRLVGTTNWPTSRKEKLGRIPVMASTVEFNDSSYLLSSFPCAEPIKKIEKKASVEIGSDVLRLGDIQELGDKVPNTVKALIVQGANAETLTGTTYESDSEAVWYVCCELVRQDISDDVIYAVITDPDFKISQHVLKQPNVHRYAIRQITRAHEQAEDPELMRMNDEFTFIEVLDGSPRVLRRSWDDTFEREVQVALSIPSFKGALVKKKIKDGKKSIPLADWWLHHPKGISFESVCFRPDGDSPKGYYNRWEGLAFRPIQGNWQLLHDHIFENICASNSSHFEYLMGWLARGVQTPGKPGQTAVVLKSAKEGTGKSFFANAYRKLFGIHGMAVSSGKHVVGNFNAHLSNVVLLFADEAFNARDKEHQSKLKTLVTEDINIVEKKGVDATASRNCISLIMASNAQFVVPAGLSDRRFFVLDVGDKHQRDYDYFEAIQTQLDNGGYEAMLYELLNRDLKKFNVKDVPATEALATQKKLAMPLLHQWWHDCLATGKVLHNREWRDFHPTDSLVWDAKQFDRNATSRSVANMFRGCATQKKRYNMEVPDPITGRICMKNSLYGWVFWELETCREIWFRETGFRVEPKEVEDDVTQESIPEDF